MDEIEGEIRSLSCDRFPFNHTSVFQILQLLGSGYNETKLNDNRSLFVRKQQLQSQTETVRALPTNALFPLLVPLLVLPMLVITVNSPNLAHQHWEGKETAKCPNNFD